MRVLSLAAVVVLAVLATWALLVIVAWLWWGDLRGDPRLVDWE
jgi:hypothetical protein